MDRTNPKAPNPSNEQIAHDLAIAYVADRWRSEERRSEEIADQNSVRAYLSSYRQFLAELERLN